MFAVICKSEYRQLKNWLDLVGVADSMKSANKMAQQDFEDDTKGQWTKHYSVTSTMDVDYIAMEIADDLAKDSSRLSTQDWWHTWRTVAWQVLDPRGTKANWEEIRCQGGTERLKEMREIFL